MSSTQKEFSARLWYALDVEIEAASHEAVEYALMEAGALGTETEEREHQRQRVTGYFSEAPDRDRVRAELTEAFRIYELPASQLDELAHDIARDTSIREVGDEDWLGEWKKSWLPVETGRFIVAPPWTNIQDAHGHIVIRIEPGMAFGTGTHETTRLCLSAIEKYFTGSSFLDVGTGTGILAIAAAKLFPQARIEACDTDSKAIAIARENARLNSVEEKITFKVGTIKDSTASADVVCANLTADVIASLLPSLLTVTCGRLILSGILNTQLEMVAASLRDASVPNAIEIMQDGEWLAIIA